MSLTRTERRFPWPELAANAVLWLVLVVSLSAFRAFLIWWFRAKLSPQAGSEAFSRCFSNGLRFDVSIATYTLLLTLLPTLLSWAVPLGRWPERMRRALTPVVLCVYALAFAIDAAYFAEYDDQFNHWIFGLVYDDRRAIFTTIWKTYPVVWLLSLCAVGALGAIWGVSRLTRAAARRVAVARGLDRRWAPAVAFALVVALTGFGLRGSLGRRPLQEKDIATTGDVLLNKLVPNPFFALYAAIRDHLSLESSAGMRSFLPDGDVRAAARALFPARGDAADLDASLERSAPGGVEPRADHVFVAVMESYDSWSMQPKFASLHLTDRVSALARDGIQAWAFVSAGSGTIKSLGAIITGLPAAGLFVNYLPLVRAGVPTSAPAIFRRLGYRTRFFYGGYLSWQRIGDFAREQGFDEVYGGDQMSAKLSGNEWGVDDAALFRFILDHTGAQPTFDVIMSTSYHPPFSVDLEASGFDIEALRKNPLCRGLSTQQLRILGHLWYSDRSLGDFVRDAEQRLDRPLFALTGDHYSREESVNPRPTLFESSAVPFVLYGRDTLALVRRPGPLAGSHLDIVPTLVDLVAPEGFRYDSFGRDLLDPAQSQVGYGNDTVITPDFVFDVRRPSHVEDLQGGAPAVAVPTADLSRKYRQLLGLGWWRAERGSAWPETETGQR
ncbi:MAG TPA: LTA synthase family protein [Myxococcota bacterium]|nr:LTA synthase family protein [Myxococcota bacterium]